MGRDGSSARSTTPTSRREAYPSQTDVNFAQNWPGMVWLIVSLRDPDQPSTRAFEINDGAIVEREVTVTE